MAFKIVDCDNVRESFASTGTTITLGGAVANSRALSSVLANGDTFFGVARKGAEVSVGLFTYTSAGGTVAQTTVYYSTNSNNAVSFSSGTNGEIFLDAPSRLFDLLNQVEITVASAATTDIGAAQGMRIAISGTTGPVTSYGTTPNKLRIVRHNGETITHNATSLILLINGTLVTDVGASSIFLSDTVGNWRQIHYRSPSRFTVAGPITSTSTGLRATLGTSGLTAHSVANLVVVENNTNTGLSILCPTSGGFEGYFIFGDAGAHSGWVKYNPTTDVMSVFTAGTQRLTLGPGLQIGAPTGGDKGAGTINATAVYDDNVLLTCPAVAEDFIKRGIVDTDYWDAKVPDRVIPGRPERIEDRPVMEPTGDYRVDLKRQDDGTYLQVKTDVPVMREVKEWTPIYDAKGNGLDALLEPVVERVVHPAVAEVREPRRHEVAHLFKAMVAEGFDPRDPVAYIAKLKKDQALPGMPTQDNWQHASLSVGEIHSRLWLATEMLALVVMGMHERMTALEARTVIGPAATKR